MQTLTPKTVEITRALTRIRKARHHPDCYCRTHKNQYCNESEEIWSDNLNRLLESTT